MANLTITEANVRLSTENSRTKQLLGGEAIDIGEVVYYDTSTQKYKLAEAGDTSAKSQATHIAITKCAADNDYFIGVELGEMVIGATITLGEIYVVSATAGKICPSGDLTTGDYITIIGVPKTTTVLDVAFNATLQQA